MKTTLRSFIALVLIGSAACLVAQDSLPPQDGPGGPGGPGRQGGPGMGGHRPPPPIIAVLDANHDGVIDADEIANASKALKKLDKNGDGKLTQDELRPPRPEGGPGQDGPPPQQ
jgi:hypothetical protein